MSSYSIGIVTLNSEQQRLIDDLLDYERRKAPDLERFFADNTEEPVFVKNLETVQGDQRDVILLSIGYGPDTPGSKTMSMNFGPLNRKGGERRLNVAITRATTEMIIFASFDPSIIDLTRTSAQAVRDLKHYLEFAERGPAALGESVLHVGGTNIFDSDFEEAVAEGLRRKGWTIHTQIGVSKFRIDLGIVHPDYPGKYLAGIECDGATYHRSPSARDRDRVRHAVLENLGWKLLRIWSTDYWIDPVRTIDQKHECLSRLLQADKERTERADEKAREVEQVQEVKEGQEDDQINYQDVLPEEMSSQIQDFEGVDVQDDEENNNPEKIPNILPQTVVQKLSAERFYEREYIPVIELIGVKLIDSLGPITFSHLSTKIARAHGFHRTGSLIKKQVWAAISKKRPKTKSPKRETIFWPENSELAEVVSFRGMKVSGEERLWQDVPYPEKVGLALSVYKAGHSDAVNKMAAQIGLGRLRQATKDELENLLEEAKKYG